MAYLVFIRFYNFYLLLKFCVGTFVVDLKILQSRTAIIIIIIFIRWPLSIQIITLLQSTARVIFHLQVITHLKEVDPPPFLGGPFPGSCLH